MYRELIEKLNENKELSDAEYLELINIPKSEKEYLFETARKVQYSNFRRGVYARGLIELTNHCRNDCYYCGIRKSNKNIKRYRLTKEEVMQCCCAGDDLGFKTFVIQGGEDPYFTAERVEDLIKSIKKDFPNNAITLSLGEADYESYKKWFDAGADRYLLRHETASAEHYSKIHPKNMSFQRRMDCLNDLKDIGYQTGTGFMVNSPYQTDKDIVKDLKFIERFGPEMVGIGPFISHHDTIFAGYKNGSVEVTLVLIAILRIMAPNVLLPATTALGSLRDSGRESGIMAGANVVMPNISPSDMRKLYSIYDNKINSGVETIEGLNLLNEKINKIGYDLLMVRGDYKPSKKHWRDCDV